MAHRIFDLLDPNLYPDAPPLYVPRRFIVAMLLFLVRLLVAVCSLLFVIHFVFSFEPRGLIDLLLICPFNLSHHFVFPFLFYFYRCLFLGYFAAVLPAYNHKLRYSATAPRPGHGSADGGYAWGWWEGVIRWWGRSDKMVGKD
jgi:hypothetical protein